MTLNDLITEIAKLCANASLGFAGKCTAVADVVAQLTRDELLNHLDDAGIIPERFDHDSTEEKLFAKYCDALLTRALAELGLTAELIVERADAADVLATDGAYRIVGDAKAFRLSRTAKNQKDFKVEALNQWRKGADYACLVCPLYQYPSSNSQIYQQAQAYNVTLLSYTHLAFLIRHSPDLADLRRLWDAPRTAPPGKSAAAYWKAIDTLVSDITHTTPTEWNDAVEAAAALLPRQAAEQIAFWEAEKTRIMALPVEAARLELVAATKIDSKIVVIKQAVKEQIAAKETFET